jgi:endonuclease/exonuclease/phosphatase family metal-dependent hydrolase
VGGVITFASFNVLDLFDDTHQGKIRNIADHVAAAAPDVIGLQEVGSLDALEGVLAALRYRGLPYPHTRVGDSDGRGIRNAVLSRLPFVEARLHHSDNLPFPVFCEGDAHPFPGRLNVRRAIVEVRVATSVGVVSTYVAHFKSKRPAPLRLASGSDRLDATSREHGESQVRSLLFRAAEALYVRGLVDDAVARGDHVCVLGDLNDTLDSLPVTLLRGRGDARLSSALADIEPSVRYSAIHDGERAHIDHVLVTSGLLARVRAAAIRNEALRDLGAVIASIPGTPDDSDHALVWARFDV